MENQVSLIVIGCSIPVDKYQPVSPIVLNEPRRRIYRQTGSAYDQHIRVPDGVDTFRDHFLIQALLIQNHIRLDDPAAVAVGHTNPVLHKFRGKKLSAAGAVIAEHRAMELIYLPGTGFLVETINILGHHSLELSRLLPLGKLFVGNVRLKPQRQHFLPVKPEEILRILT